MRVSAVFERLKNDGTILGKKYFEEQLQRIREILQNAGKVTAEIAKANAESEFDKEIRNGFSTRKIRANRKSKSTNTLGMADI